MPRSTRTAGSGSLWSLPQDAERQLRLAARRESQQGANVHNVADVQANHGANHGQADAAANAAADADADGAAAVGPIAADAQGNAANAEANASTDDEESPLDVAVLAQDIANRAGGPIDPYAFPDDPALPVAPVDGLTARQEDELEMRLAEAVVVQHETAGDAAVAEAAMVEEAAAEEPPAPVRAPAPAPVRAPAPAPVRAPAPAPVRAPAPAPVRSVHFAAPLRFGKGKKRHRKVIRDSIQGITKPAIRRLARRGGVKRISGLMYEETRGILAVFLKNVIRDAVTYTEHARRKTCTAQDVVYALRRQGRVLYGFGNK